MHREAAGRKPGRSFAKRFACRAGWPSLALESNGAWMVVAHGHAHVHASAGIVGDGRGDGGEGLFGFALKFFFGAASVGDGFEALGKLLASEFGFVHGSAHYWRLAPVLDGLSVNACSIRLL